VILEVAVLDVRPDEGENFRRDFAGAQGIISSMPGYIEHELQHCVEDTNRYILLVRWETLEDHTIGFRESPQYLEWKKILHHYYDPFPIVQHYESVAL
jgi:heme-degrading monooxygenase HmoA